MKYISVLTCLLSLIGCSSSVVQPRFSGAMQETCEDEGGPIELCEVMVHHAVHRACEEGHVEDLDKIGLYCVEIEPGSIR